jgi:hypothetical protein
MASCCQPCEYCGMTPCVGDRCPQWDDDDDFADLDDDEDYGYCDACGVALRVGEVDGICVHCATRDHVTGEWWDDDAPDPRGYEADQ